MEPIVHLAFAATMIPTFIVLGAAVATLAGF
jgi:hypothetical protein